jgi:MYXO-CTERM domain-containing protein
MRALNLVLALGISLGLTAASAHAAIVETMVDPATESVLGSITFPTLTGDSAEGVLFSYQGFTEGDITTIEWTLDAGTLDVTALALIALQGDAGCSIASVESCSNKTLTLGPTLGSLVSETCGGGFCTTSRRAIRVAFVPAVPVPEPSTWLLGLVGFLGLGALRSRRHSFLSGLRGKVA